MVTSMCDDPEQQYCLKHRLGTSVQCDYVYASGFRCTSPSCGDCWEYAKSTDILLPLKTTMYCYSCINKLATQKNNPAKKSFYDLTLKETHSDDSSIVTKTDETTSTTNDTFSVGNTRRKLFHSPQLDSSTDNDDDEHDSTPGMPTIDSDESDADEEDNDVGTDEDEDDTEKTDDNDVYVDDNPVEDNDEGTEQDEDDTEKNDDNDVYVDDNTN